MKTQNRLNILITAYRCEPGRGGEPGVGWNFSKHMASHHNVWVLTRLSHKKLIEAEVAINPVEGLSFLYYDVSQDWLISERRIGEQAYYLIWEVCSMSAYKRAAKEINFDLIHHLTFNQYRSPSIGFFTSKPFVMGPIGGAETINSVFYKDLEYMGRVKEKWRNLGLDILLFRWLCRFKNNPKRIVFSSAQNRLRLQNSLNRNSTSEVIPAIAIDKRDFEGLGTSSGLQESQFIIVYSGTAKDWKGLLIFLRSFARAFLREQNVNAKLIGIRTEKERKKVNGWIAKLELQGRVELIDFLPRHEVIKHMTKADVAVYPAFRDSGSMSVLEACALGCPVVCFDAGGQDAFPDSILFKVPIASDSYEKNIENLAGQLAWCNRNREQLKQKGEEAKEHVLQNFTWESRVSLFSSIYWQMLIAFQAAAVSKAKNTLSTS